MYLLNSNFKLNFKQKILINYLRIYFLHFKFQKYFLKKLTKLRKKDVLFGSSSIGPQRDDFILANKKKIRFTNYASQGQRRTAAVTLKISECEIVEAEKNKKSIILVDDIFSELDEKRRSQIIEVLQRGNQIIFTMVHFDPLQLNKFRNYKGFYIDLPGNVRELTI